MAPSACSTHTCWVRGYGGLGLCVPSPQWQAPHFQDLRVSEGPSLGQLSPHFLGAGRSETRKCPAPGTPRLRGQSWAEPAPSWALLHRVVGARPMRVGPSAGFLFCPKEGVLGHRTTLLRVC